MKKPVTEKELLKRCTNGDREAYAFLYTAYLSDLTRYLYLFNRSKEDNEEIVQEVFLRIWERKGDLEKILSFRAYVFRVAKNLLVDYIRQRRSELRMLQYAMPLSEDSGERIDDVLCYEQYNEVAMEAISQLTEKRRQIFELRTQDGLSLDEISDKLNISKNVVRKQFYAASGFIKEYLRVHGKISLGLFFMCINP